VDSLSIWVPQYFKKYGFTIAQASFLAACFSLPGAAFRVFGGWLSDRFGQCHTVGAVGDLGLPVSAVLSQADLIVQTIRDPVSFRIALPSSKSRYADHIMVRQYGRIIAEERFDGNAGSGARKAAPAGVPCDGRWAAVAGSTITFAPTFTRS
jgi:hypothetical protein